MIQTSSSTSSTEHGERLQEVGGSYPCVVVISHVDHHSGFAISANSANFPALFTGNGAMTVGVMGPWYVLLVLIPMFPCLIILFSGANSPHTHPRATEIQIVVQGGPIYTEFIMENGASPVQNTVPLGSATIFPKGSIHFQQNMGKLYSLTQIRCLV